MHPQFRIVLGPETYLKVWIQFYVYPNKYAQKWKNKVFWITVNWYWNKYRCTIYHVTERGSFIVEKASINQGIPWWLLPPGTYERNILYFPCDGGHIFDVREQSCILCISTNSQNMCITGRWCLFSKLVDGLWWNKALGVTESMELNEFSCVGLLYLVADTVC